MNIFEAFVFFFCSSRVTPQYIWASFHQPHLPLRRCVVVVRNLLHVDLRTTVARSRGKPLDLEVSELERGTLATFENPEILEVNAGE